MLATYRGQGPDDPNGISVFIFPAGPYSDTRIGDAASCRTQFDLAVQSFLSQEVDARLRPTPPASVTVPELDPAFVHSAEVGLMIGGPALTRFDLYCFVDRGWMIYFSTSGGTERTRAEAVETFVRAGPWPGRTLPAAPTP